MMANQGIEKGRGGVFLSLTDEQNAKLIWAPPAMWGEIVRYDHDAVTNRQSRSSGRPILASIDSKIATQRKELMNAPSRPAQSQGRG